MKAGRVLAETFKALARLGPQSVLTPNGIVRSICEHNPLGEREIEKLPAQIGRALVLLHGAGFVELAPVVMGRGTRRLTAEGRSAFNLELAGRTNAEIADKVREVAAIVEARASPRSPG